MSQYHSLLPSKQANGDIVVNGRAQVIDILKNLDESHRVNLLKNLAKKNAPLARELSLQTVSFQSFLQLSPKDLALTMEYVSDLVLSYALHRADDSSLKKVLSSLPSGRALSLFGQLKKQQVMISEQQRAQQKIVEIMTTLAQQKIIQPTLF